MLNILGIATSEQGDYVNGRAYFEQSLHICRETGDRWGEDMRLVNLGWISTDEGRYDEARMHLEQALHTAREIGDLWNEGEALTLMGGVLLALGSYDQSRRYFEQALANFRKTGNQEGECWALARQSLLWYCHGDCEAAREYGERALSIAQKIASAYQAEALTNLGHALIGLNRPAEASDTYSQALALRRQWGQRNLALDPLAGLARVSLAQGNLPQAHTIVEEILSNLETGSLDGAKEPFRVYLTCYRALAALRDPRAAVVLDQAHRLLQARAAQITDAELRRSFLENVAAHREILSEWANQRVGG